MKTILFAAIAAAITPAALSFASTQAPPAAAAQERMALPPQQASLPPEAKPACKPAARVAYAGYGEAARVCGLADAALLAVPGQTRR